MAGMAAAMGGGMAASAAGQTAGSIATAVETRKSQAESNRIFSKDTGLAGLQSTLDNRYARESMRSKELDNNSLQMNAQNQQLVQATSQLRSMGLNYRLNRQRLTNEHDEKIQQMGDQNQQFWGQLGERKRQFTSQFDEGRRRYDKEDKRWWANWGEDHADKELARADKRMSLQSERWSFGLKKHLIDSLLNA